MGKEIYIYICFCKHQPTNQPKSAQEAKNSSVLKCKFQHAGMYLDLFAILTCLEYICTLAIDCTNPGANRHYLSVLHSQPHGRGDYTTF